MKLNYRVPHLAKFTKGGNSKLACLTGSVANTSWWTCKNGGSCSGGAAATGNCKNTGHEAVLNAGVGCGNGSFAVANGNTLYNTFACSNGPGAMGGYLGCGDGLNAKQGAKWAGGNVCRQGKDHA